jgi:hypothetical protein
MLAITVCRKENEKENVKKPFRVVGSGLLCDAVTDGYLVISLKILKLTIVSSRKQYS